MFTQKLYDNNAYISEFKATVISCKKSNNKFEIVLDKTAFFPEAGGQKCDTGYISDSKVTDVQIKNGIIYHYALLPVAEKSEVICKINFEKRYKKMQIHTGEHIVSGIMHNMFGLENVGFHLGESEVTLDFNAPLTRKQLNNVELLANDVIYKNVPVKCYYPEKSELKNIKYRSKKEIDGELRIVEITGYDVCACCAPHVAYTGEVGIIKLTKCEKHKSGTRITMLCAGDAVLDYEKKYESVSKISALLCKEPDNITEGVEILLAEKSEMARKISDLKRTVNKLKAEYTEKSDEPYFLFETEELSVSDMRNFANEILKKRPSVYIVSPTSKGGFNYLCAGNNMRDFLNKLSTEFAGGGGGTDKMIQGTLKAEKSEIEKFFITNIDK